MDSVSRTVRRRWRVSRLGWSVAGVLIVLLTVAVRWTYWSLVDHRLTTISRGRLYQSEAMPLADLTGVVKEQHLRSVVDLRTSTERGPTRASEGEHLGTLGVRYFNLPSAQLPDDATIDRFLVLAADPENYPMLIHCYHGEGRSILLAAIYRIEFEGWTNEEARRATKLLSFRGAFAPDGPKGRLLRGYRCRVRADLPARTPH